MGWQKPTSHTANGWGDPGYAYDGNTGTSATYDIPNKQWSPWLELYIGEIDCSKVRSYVNIEDTWINNMEVEVFYGDTWENVFSGAPSTGDYVEHDIGSTQAVTGMRVRFYNNHNTQYRLAYIVETDFWEVEITPTEQICTVQITGGATAVKKTTKHIPFSTTVALSVQRKTMLNIALAVTGAATALVGKKVEQICSFVVYATTSLAPFVITKIAALAVQGVTTLGNFAIVKIAACTVQAAFGIEKSIMRIIPLTVQGVATAQKHVNKIIAFVVYGATSTITGKALTQIVNLVVNVATSTVRTPIKVIHLTVTGATSVLKHTVKIIALTVTGAPGVLKHATKIIGLVINGVITNIAQKVAGAVEQICTLAITAAPTLAPFVITKIITLPVIVSFVVAKAIVKIIEHVVNSVATVIAIPGLIVIQQVVSVAARIVTVVSNSAPIITLLSVPSRITKIFSRHAPIE